MPPTGPPGDHHLDREISGMTGLAFEPEWLDDYAWAATELGSPAPDFSSCSLPGIRANDTDLSTTPSASSTAEHDQSTLCTNFNKTQRSCIGITTGIIGSMGSNSPLCMMGNRENSLSMPSSIPSTSTIPKTSHSCVDAVLSTTQEASRLIRSLLDCPTCRAGPQLQLLLTVAFAEVICRYRRVISTYYNMQKQTNGPRAHEELRRTPLSIGSHLIEGNMEAMLVGRVIASRLQELELVMGDILAVRVAAQSQGPDPDGGDQGDTGSGGNSNGHSSANPTGLLGEMYKRRDLYLAEQFTAAKRELNELLVQCETGVGVAPVP